jgi:TonB family protein
MRSRRAQWSLAVLLLAVVAPIAAQEASFEEQLRRASQLLVSNPRGALSTFSDLERSRPDSCLDCLLGIAAAQIRLGGFMAAEKAARRTLELSAAPEVQIVANTLLGVSFYERTPLGGLGPELESNMTQAEAAFRRAYELDRRGDETLRWNLASALEWLGRSDEANALFSDPVAAPEAEATPLEAAPGAGPDPVAPGPLFVTGKVQKPVKISDVQPEYSTRARKMRIQGEVVLQSVISERGEVARVKVLKGVPGCTMQAIRALRQWTFHPATLEGKPVAVYFTLTVNFTLR